MEQEPKVIEILDIEDTQDEEDSYQLTLETIKNNSIYSNFDLQFNELFLK